MKNIESTISEKIGLIDEATLHDMIEIKQSIKDIATDIGALFENFMGLALEKPKALPMKALAICYDDVCDKIIYNAVKNEKLEFIAGKFSFHILENKNFQMKIAIYFQNSTGSWVVKEKTSEALPMGKYLNAEAEKELCDEKTVEFEIQYSPPEF